jgi:argininosuccinate synthase
VKAVASSKVKKVVLAYSGGLDTSVILKWLQDTYGCEVVTFTADLGQVSRSSTSRSSSKAAAAADSKQQQQAQSSKALRV